MTLDDLSVLMAKADVRWLHSAGKIYTTNAVQ
jgi:hypothetical protein